jgi:hypothetical protein
VRESLKIIQNESKMRNKYGNNDQPNVWEWATTQVGGVVVRQRELRRVRSSKKKCRSFENIVVDGKTEVVEKIFTVGIFEVT